MSMSTSTTPTYDAILIVGFGGPEKPDDVMPFLENVTRGRNIPRERMLEVAEHYQHFGGVSPINSQVRDLIAALRPELDRHGVDLPIYWGNRNWHPMLADTVRAMADAGVETRPRRRPRCLRLVFELPAVPRGHRARPRGRRPVVPARGQDAGLLQPPRLHRRQRRPRPRGARSLPPLGGRTSSSRRTASRARWPRTATTRRSSPRPAGSWPRPSASSPDRWQLVYQSRSGRPTDPWLEPDILDHIATLHSRGALAVVVHPIGFLSDHVEVLFDLDEEARRKAEGLGMAFARSATVGTHPQFVGMLRELIQERITGSSDRRAIGRFEASHDVCAVDCCLPSARPAG